MKKKILSILVLILCFGLLLSSISALGSLSDYIKLPNAEEDNQNIIEDFVPQEFGGHTALYSDFSEVYVGNGNWYVSDVINPYTNMNQNMYFASNNGIDVYSTSGDNGSIIFEHKSNNPFNTSVISDPYAIVDNRIFSTYNNTVNYLDSSVADYLCITLDVDVSLPENFDGHTFTIRPLWRDKDNKIIYRSAVSGYGFCPFRVQDGYALGIDGEQILEVSNNFHLTVIVYSDNGNIVCDYYVDGKLVLNTYQGNDLIIPSIVTKLTGLRIGLSGNTANNDEFIISVDNAIINYFDKNYDGDISKALNSSTVDLNYNSDTVLGQKNNDIFKINFQNKGVNGDEGYN